MKGQYGYQTNPYTGLILAGHRFYSPNQRRWMNRDPIGYSGGINLYAYCDGDPVNGADPDGTQDNRIPDRALLKYDGMTDAQIDAYYAQQDKARAEFNERGKTFHDWYINIASLFLFGPEGPGIVEGAAAKGVADTAAESAAAKEAVHAPYSSLTDPADVAAGKDFTAAQKAEIIKANMVRNGGIVRSDATEDSYDILFQPAKSAKGQTPLPYEWQIDHIIPKANGGTNSYSNARVISRALNRSKWHH